MNAYESPQTDATVLGGNSNIQHIHSNRPSDHNETQSLWANVKVPHSFELRNDGVYSITDNKKSSAKIAGPVWVHAETDNPTDGTYGIVLRWINRRGEQQEQAFPREILHDPKSLTQRLSSKGLSISPQKERQLAAYLAAFDPDSVLWMQAVTRVGWMDSTDGSLTYVLPDQVLPSSKQGGVIFQPEQHSPTTSSVRTSGTLADWQQRVAERCRCNPFLIFSVSAALSGPLLRASGSAEAGGFHFYGYSSRGKTTACQVAASVYGCGADPSSAPDLAFIQRWNTTSNALEALASAHNDNLLVLDEIHTCPAKDFGQVIYNLAGGRGKAAMDKDRNLKQQRGWRTMILSTGEMSSRDKIEETGKAYAGMSARLVDIPTGENIIADTHGKQPVAFVDTLKRDCGTYYGTAGPAFIHALTEKYGNHHRVSAVVQNELDQLADVLTPAASPPEQKRAIRRFALVNIAGRLAVDFGILPFTRADIDAAIKVVLNAWISDESNVTDAISGAVSVQQFILTNEGRFRRAKDESGSAVPARGYAGYTCDLPTGKHAYLFTLDGFKEACGPHSLEAVRTALREHGLLHSNEPGRPTYKTTVHINGSPSRLRVYAVLRDIVEHDFTSVEQAGTGGTHGTS